MKVTGRGGGGAGPPPKTPIKLRRHWNLSADADRLPCIGVPGFCEVGPADDAVVNFFDDLDGVWRRALLRAELHQLPILLLRLHQHLAFGGIVAAWLFDIDVLTRL